MVVPLSAQSITSYANIDYFVNNVTGQGYDIYDSDMNLYKGSTYQFNKTIDGQTFTTVTRTFHGTYGYTIGQLNFMVNAYSLFDNFASVDVRSIYFGFVMNYYADSAIQGADLADAFVRILIDYDNTVRSYDLRVVRYAIGYNTNYRSCSVVYKAYWDYEIDNGGIVMPWLATLDPSVNQNIRIQIINPVTNIYVTDVDIGVLGDSYVSNVSQFDSESDIIVPPEVTIPPFDTGAVSDVLGSIGEIPVVTLPNVGNVDVNNALLFRAVWGSNMGVMLFVPIVLVALSCFLFKMLLWKDV